MARHDMHRLDGSRRAVADGLREIMSELQPQEFEALANRIEGLGHGAVLVESERSLILYALRSLVSMNYKIDKYGLALMMIRAGAADPEKVASNALANPRS